MIDGKWSMVNGQWKFVFQGPAELGAPENNAGVRQQLDSHAEE